MSKVNVPSLNDEQFTQANKDLNDSSFVTNYPKIMRTFADPIYNNQTYSLHSFIPAKGATPNESGIFGMIKFRGVFPSIDEANDRAEWIIKNVDSYNPILTGYVGRPFPLTGDNKKFCTETKEVDLNKKTEEIVGEDLKEKRREDKKVVTEIKEKEKRLLEDVREDKPVDPAEDYTTLRVKRSQLIFTYNETFKKMQQMLVSMEATENEIRAMDEESSQYKEDYLERYRAARAEVGLTEEQQDNFMKYLNKDEHYTELLEKII